MTLVKPASLKLSNSPRSATGPYLTLDPEESQPPGASPKRMFLIHQNSVFQSGTRLVLDVLFLSFFLLIFVGFLTFSPCCYQVLQFWHFAVFSFQLAICWSHFAVYFAQALYRSRNFSRHVHDDEWAQRLVRGRSRKTQKDLTLRCRLRFFQRILWLIGAVFLPVTELVTSSASSDFLSSSIESFFLLSRRLGDCSYLRSAAYLSSWPDSELYSPTRSSSYYASPHLRWKKEPGPHPCSALRWPRRFAPSTLHCCRCYKLDPPDLRSSWAPRICRAFFTLV